MALLARSFSVVKTVRSTKILHRFLSASNSLNGRVVPFKLSDIGEGIREVTVKEWFVKPGDKVKQFDNVCEVQSDKASVTITSRYDGFIKSLRYKIDEIALVGQPLVDIEVDDDDKEEEREEKKECENDSIKSSQDKRKTSDNEIINDDDENIKKRREFIFGKVLTTPAVRRIAMEKGIRLNEVVGTGKNGRILKEDVLAYDVENETDESSSESDVDDKKILTENYETVVPKLYAKHMWTTMTKSLSIPHFVYSDECDVTKLFHFRNEVKSTFKENGLSITFMPFFIKAVSKCLEKYPELNARLNEKFQTVDLLTSHNISIAIDTSHGLVVPNIKNVQNLNVVEIAKELNRLQDIAKKGSIPPNDLTGGTFTISNIGAIGGTYTKPVILSPQIAIGAIGRAQKLPRFDSEGKVVAAQILTVSWSADHRVVDGVTIAKFSNQWKFYLENPSILVMNG